MDILVPPIIVAMCDALQHHSKIPMYNLVEQELISIPSECTPYFLGVSFA